MLLLLIRLEFIMISLFYNIYLILLIYDSNIYILISFLVIRVCESVLGLSIIVILVRICGNDYINSLSLIKW